MIEKLCQECGQQMKKIAHDTGDGWALSYDCKEGHYEDIEWDDKWDDYMTVRDIKSLGFEIV